MKKNSRFGFLTLSAAVVLFVLAGILIGNVVARETNVYVYLRLFNDAVHLIENNYVEEVDSDRLLRGAYHGLFEALDPQSEYLLPQEYALLMGGGPAPRGDVGLHLHRTRGHLVVLSVRPGSPADRAGIATGDQIIRIEEVSTRAMSLFGAERRLRGTPGTGIGVTVIGPRGGGSRDETLVRELAPAAVDLERTAGGTGHLRLRSLPADAASQVEGVVRQFRNAGGERLILDLRNNHSRSLQAALDTARLFLGPGPVLLVEERDGGRSPIDVQSASPLWGGPLLVLVNAGTASGGEAIAAALQGRDRSLLLGQKTYGAGTRPELFPLPNGAAVQLSTGKLVAANGTVWQGTGLAPDVRIDPDLSEEEMLRRAEEVLDNPELRPEPREEAA